MTTALNALKQLGFNLEYNERDVTRLVKLWQNIKACCGSGKFEDAIVNLDDGDFLTKQTTLELTEILSMMKNDYIKQQELKNQIRNHFNF